MCVHKQNQKVKSFFQGLIVQWFKYINNEGHVEREKGQGNGKTEQGDNKNGNHLR